MEKLSDEESDAYFDTRPLGAQIGAHAVTAERLLEAESWLEVGCGS